jgi:hypothetical protein
MKIALYKTEYCTSAVFEASDWMDNEGSYIRISEIIEVEFVMLTKAETLSKEISLIDAQIEDLQMDYGSRISKLKEKKQELLAIGVDQ